MLESEFAQVGCGLTLKSFVLGQKVLLGNVVCEKLDVHRIDNDSYEWANFVRYAGDRLDIGLAYIPEGK